MRKLFILLILISAHLFSFSQFQDTVYIDEVKVSAEAIESVEYLVGSKGQRFDSLLMSKAAHMSLAEAISLHTPIYLKQNAGGLSTMHMRGTTADHVAVMFGDVNVNSLTLGHSNMANIPMFLFDNVEVQYGSSSSLYGTDAIGGTIHLISKTNWKKGVGFYAQQDVASFGSYFSGLKFIFGNGKWENSTHFYRYSSKNDFPFENTMAYDVERKQYINDHQKNAAIFQYGMLNRFALKLSEKSNIDLKLWYDNNWHETQPNMSTNYYGGTFEESEEDHVRAVLSYNYRSDAHSVTTNLNYVRDHLVYNDDISQTIATNRAVSKLEYEHKKLWDGSFKIGTKAMYIVPDVYAYDDISAEQRIDLYAAYRKTFAQRLTSSVNLRQIFINNYESQFVPAINLNFKALRLSSGILSIKASASKSYKIPTLNDRFWRGQGDPNIKPEKGLNFELGELLQLDAGNNTFSLEVSEYYLLVDDWIQWVNKGKWVPTNKQKVNSWGVEVSGKYKTQIGQSSLRVIANYSFNRSVPIESYENSDEELHEQLFYSPPHTGNISLGYSYLEFSCGANFRYTGQRYNEAREILADYFLFGLNAEYSFRFGNYQLTGRATCNNLFNQSYENWENYAMPGRSFRVSIIFTR